MKKVIPLFVVLLVLLIGCKIPMAQPPNYEFEDGTLVLVLGSDDMFKAITIDPGDLTIGSFVISGTSTSSGDLTPVTIDTPISSYSIPGLTADTWTITVDAYDGAGGSGVHIATDTEVAVVTVNSVTTVDIVVEPLTTGTGTLNLNLVWSADDVLDVTTTQFTALLGATDLTPDFGVINNTLGSVNINNASLAPGYYLLSITLDDTGLGGTFDKTIIAAVRIVTGYETSDTIDFNDPGGVTLNLGEDLKNAYNLSFSGVVDPIYLPTDPAPNTPSSMTVTVGVDIDGDLTPDTLDGSETFSWYLNGVQIPGVTGATHTINSTDSSPVEGVGFYTLTVVVDYKGILSSNDTTFTIEE